MSWPCPPQGYSLIELTTVLMLAAVIAGAAVPQLRAGVADIRVLSAARYLAARMQSARTDAVSRGQAVALRVAVRGRDVYFAAYRDGNHNGVRSVDIAGAQDPLIEAEVSLGALFSTVRAGASDGGEPPPVAGEHATLFSFSPAGTSSSGTVYLRGNGPAQYAVRILGVTGRVRVLRFSAAAGDWVEVR